MAFASAAVPDWALANPTLHNSANAANAEVNILLFMAFSLLTAGIRRRNPKPARILAFFPASCKTDGTATASSPRAARTLIEGPGIACHVKAALQQGAAREEISETLGMAI
jgi:hypothetical protein